MRSSRNHLLFLFGVLGLFIVSVWATHALFTSENVGANDFFPRWIGAQVFWQEGIDPYSQTATERIQRGMYNGRLARPDQDQALFVYPFYTIFLLLPLTWLPLDYTWIQAIWLVTLQFALIGAIFLLLRLVEWPPLPVWLLTGMLLWAVVFYHNARNIILGQFAALVFLWLVGCLLALRHNREVLAGVLLALTTVKPQMSFMVIPVLLLWGVWQRRWRFAGSFAGAMVVLAGLSFLLLPGWLVGFIAQVRAYPGYTITPSPLRFITEYFFPWLGRPVEIGAIVLLVAYMLWEWWRLRRITAVTPEFLVIIGVTLVVTNMIVVRTATTNYVVMYIPLFLGLRVLATRTRRGETWVGLFLLLSTIAIWWLFVATIKGDLEHPIMYLPMPLGVLLLLILGRRQLVMRPDGFAKPFGSGRKESMK